MLQVNQSIKSQLTGETLTVKAKLGEGGQGIVYLVEGPKSGKAALKWYHASRDVHFAGKQRQAILELARTGPPGHSAAAAKRFVWPRDLVDHGGQFGYIMDLVDMKRYATLGQVWSRKRRQPGMRALTAISFQLAHSYRVIHLSGHCYSDVNGGNVLFDPDTGDVLICDNDNVRPDGCEPPVLGTMEYMAPEVIMGRSHPRMTTDSHSLAVLLFHLWCWHHPMHGDLECGVKCWDIPAKRLLYGEKPVFIFDPKNTTNRPNHAAYGTVRARWKFCPQPLQQLFERAFTEGLHEPGRRVTDGEWQKMFLQLGDTILSCPSCRAENFWLVRTSKEPVTCWHCHKPVTKPMSLRLPEYSLALTQGAKLRPYHIDRIHGHDHADQVIGEVVPNPNDPNVWGLRNLTSKPWTAVLQDGTSKEIPPQRALPLLPGARLHIDGIEGEMLTH